MYEILYDYISPIFGYIMLFFYGIVDSLNGSYGWAIILFTIFARCVMLPTTISQQKGMAKQQRLAPKIRRIQEKFAGNQQKIQEETQKLYQREGYNPMSAGCLPLLIQMPFIIGLFGVLYNPLRYAIGLDKEIVDGIIEAYNAMIKEGIVGKNTELHTPLYIIQNFDLVKEYLSTHQIGNINFGPALESIQSFITAERFEFFGLQLGVVPKEVKLVKYWIVPIFSGLTSFLSAYITQAQQKKANPSMNTPGAGCTMLMMPITSLIFTFMFPCGIGIYWIVSNVFATIQSVILKKIFSPQKNIAKHMVNETIERRSREASVKRIHK